VSLDGQGNPISIILLGGHCAEGVLQGKSWFGPLAINIDLP
jgi:hypothetical protein